MRQRGFTLIEVLLTMALLAMLFGLIAVNLGKPQTVASLNGAVETLVSDLRAQQALAMSGNAAGETTQQAHGLYVAADSYTVFAGDTYNGSDPDNYTVTPGRDITLSTSFADSQVVFERASGEVADFSDGNNTITVAGDEGSRVITINRFGTVTVE